MKDNFVKLKELCISVKDGEHGTVINDDNGDYYLLSNKNIVDNRIVISSDDRKINKETYDKLMSKQKIEENDVLISTVGTIGKTYVIQEKSNYVFQRSVGIIKPDLNKVNPYYLKYQLDLQNNLLERLANGGVQKGLYIADLEKILIKVIPIEIQNKIGEFLKKIDQQININYSIMHNIEELIELKYNYWFIQYNYPSNVKCNLIVDELTNKKIPANWKYDKAKNIIKSINTGLNPRNNFKLGNGYIKYITVKNINADGTIDFNNCDLVDEKARKIIHKRSDVSKGDILYTSISPFGRAYLLQENPSDWDINESVFCIRPNFDRTSSSYLFSLLKSDLFTKKAEHLSAGSIFKGIRIDTLLNMSVLIPSKEIADSFDKEVSSFLKIFNIKNKENAELEEMKKFFIPLLFNEQVIINE